MNECEKSNRNVENEVENKKTEGDEKGKGKRTGRGKMKGRVRVHPPTRTTPLHGGNSTLKLLWTWGAMGEGNEAGRVPS